MKRTRSSPNEEIYLPKSLNDKFKKYPNYVYILALYVFYYETALRQRTNQPKATDTFCMAGLRIGREKFYDAKRVLIKLNIVDQIEVGKTPTKFGSFYIRVNTYQAAEMRSTPIRSPLENKEFQDKNDASQESGIPRNPAVFSDPDYLNRESNAYKEKINALRLALEQASTKEDKLKLLIMECPFHHEFGVEYDKYYEDCDKCVDINKMTWAKCLMSNKIHEKDNDEGND